MGTNPTKGEEELDNGDNDFSKEKQNTNLNTQASIRLVNIQIPINKENWEKPYNIEESLDQVAMDFRKENGMENINNNYYIQWYFNNKEIEMNSKKIKVFMQDNNMDGASSFIINQRIIIKPGKENIVVNEVCDIVGKPFFNPFEIFTFEAKEKRIKIKKYNKENISKTQIDLFCVESAYCNGNNHLFISGGVNPITREAINLLWDIDLKSDSIDLPIQIIPYKNHSMVYKEKFVYIVGGENKQCLFYDINGKQINSLGVLNEIRFEPSLIVHENYLFCFDSSPGKYNKFSLERINSNSLSQPKWEILCPRISNDLESNTFRQKFYGLVEDINQNIIFLGGIYETPNSNENDNNEIMK